MKSIIKHRTISVSAKLTLHVHKCQSSWIHRLMKLSLGQATDSTPALANLRKGVVRPQRAATRTGTKRMSMPTKEVQGGSGGVQ